MKDRERTKVFISKRYLMWLFICGRVLSLFIIRYTRYIKLVLFSSSDMVYFVLYQRVENGSCENGDAIMREWSRYLKIKIKWKWLKEYSALKYIVFILPFLIYYYYLFLSIIRYFIRLFFSWIYKSSW